MDGAIRFTQRDALAAVLITGVNIVAGLIIGVFQHGLDLGDRRADLHDPDRRRRPGHRDSGAARLDVGRLDHHARGVRIEPRRGSRGAVAGARAAAGGRRAACWSALALIPGLPKLSFLVVAALLGGAAYANARTTESRRTAATPTPTRRRRRSDAPAPVDPLSVEVGYALVALVDEKQGGTLLNRAARDPPADRRPRPASSCRRCTSPTTCSSGRATYAILVKGVEVARGELYAGSPAGHQSRARRRAPLDGSATREPAFGLPAWWIADRRSASSASAAGYTVVDPTTALSTHLSETIRDVPAGSAQPPADQGAGRPRRRRRRRSWSRSWCRSSCRSATSSACCGSCCASACRCAISTTILEAIADAAAVDQGSGRDHRSGARGDGPSHLPASTRTSAASCRRSALRRRSRRSCCRRSCAPSRAPVLALDPSQAQQLASRIAEALAGAVAQPVLLCTPTLRPHLWRLFARVLPHIGVLSHSEVPPQLRIATVAVLD